MENSHVDYGCLATEVQSRDSSVSIVTSLRPEPLSNRGYIPGRGKKFLFSQAPVPAVRPSQPLIKCALRGSFWDKVVMA